MSQKRIWKPDPKKAVAIQRELAARVDVTKPLADFTLLGAADVSNNRFSREVHATVVVLDRATGEIRARASVSGVATFPYIPGLLSFREVPILLRAFAKLRIAPEVLLCDGQGYCHPRRVGLASHLGLELGLPTVGCAKSVLVGTFREPGRKRGARSRVEDRGELVGYALRSKDDCAPLIVSPGHLCDFESAARLVLEQSGKLRVPTPLALAHDLSNEQRRRRDARRL